MENRRNSLHHPLNVDISFLIFSRRQSLPAEETLQGYTITVSNKRALVVFAKAPIPGTVKTRLCPPLSPEEATALHASFAMDAIERTKKVAGKLKADRLVACDPDMAHPFFNALRSHHGVKLLQQRGQDLGERMGGIMQELFDRDYSSVVITGSDLPTLPSGEISQAFGLLADHDCVLGPCPDGGYYLVGLRCPRPELFSDVPWGTSEVLQLTKDKAAALNLKLGLTAPWSDIDTPDDLRTLINEKNRKDLSQRTARLLQTLSSRLKHRVDDL
ncbi:MAG TPA: glycosyltransferase [Nitrospirales bacterium]|nr:glycosyltransferase [Nitrospirales bacterium]HIA13613.1 glycosyltransferase [Nitrospirales bacterium]